MKRVRVVQYVVKAVVVVDDGEDLAPLDVEPLTIAASGWDTFVETGLPAALAKLEADLNVDETAST